MPELPEVEILVRHLAPLVQNKTVYGVTVHRKKVIAPTSEIELTNTLRNATFTGLTRRGKYLLFTLQQRDNRAPILLVGHLGMTGRIYLSPKKTQIAKHAAVVLDLKTHDLVYEDTRYFGRFTLDSSMLAKLGPEPLGPEFTAEYFATALKQSGQPIKTKLLDQSLVAGVGNIYASESLFRAGIDPRKSAMELSKAQSKSLWKAIREVLRKAIRFGSTVPLNFGANTGKDALFYYGGADDATAFHPERLLVYDRSGQPCVKCGTPIKRIVQNARSTFYCPNCQS